MIRKVTKVSTVTPMTKSQGSGVANIGKGKLKAYKDMIVAKISAKKAEKEGAMEYASDMPRIAMKSERRPKSESMMMGAIAGMPQLMRKAVKTGTKAPKAKAKMLPEVTVTAPKPKKRLALKVTSKRMR